MKGMFLHIILFVIILAIKSEVISNSKTNCPTKCGNITISFPFGTSKNCSLNNFFLLTCNQTSSPPTLFLKRENFLKKLSYMQVRVLNISLHGELIVSLQVASICNSDYNGKGKSRGDSQMINVEPFHLSSTRNKFTVVGSNTLGVVAPFDSFRHSSSCVSLFNTLALSNESCLGIGCCEILLPRNLSKFTYISYPNSFNKNKIGDTNPYPCSYAFLVEDGKYQFSATHTTILNLNKNTTFPVVVDWTVGNQTCLHVDKSASNYACKSEHSVCYSTKMGYGYLCNCSSGFRGNPYLFGGCQDINECEELNNCAAQTKCINFPLGTYHCSCPNGYKGDGKINGTGCKIRTSRIIIIALSLSVGILTLFGGTVYFQWKLNKKKFIKLKERHFQQNGGLLLQQHLSNNTESSEMTKIFTMGELKEATRDFDACMILGEGGQGTVYKGILHNERVVAIKKSKISYPNQVEDFINEVIMLSRVNHRNVVKLLGCCLETEIPLLVYEFVPNGTVYQCLHHQGHLLSWKTRLQIATETAEAFAYLHSATSPPIIHRDVKSSNMLLDYNLTAKVSDFGISKTIPRDQTQFFTSVRGTIGYLDPAYYSSGQLTEKSDVYSFGIVLVELLTGKKAIFLNRQGYETSLATYLHSSIDRGQLANIMDIRIRDEAIVEQLTEVANIATHCLRMNPMERPTMKEVAIKLDGIRILEKYRWETLNSSSEDADRRRIHRGSDISERISWCLSGGR